MESCTTRPTLFLPEIGWVLLLLLLLFICLFWGGVGVGKYTYNGTTSTIELNMWLAASPRWLILLIKPFSWAIQQWIEVAAARANQRHEGRGLAHFNAGSWNYWECFSLKCLNNRHYLRFFLTGEQKVSSFFFFYSCWEFKDLFFFFIHGSVLFRLKWLWFKASHVM